MRNYWGSRGIVWLSGLAALVVAIGCHSGKEPDSEEGESVPRVTPSQLPPGEQQAEHGEPSTGPGVVIAGKELGMTVSGPGAGTPGRSLDILERQILTLLPELRETYGRERVQDLALMGSLEVHMVIEPNGGVSDLRFPVKRVSNDRLTAAVFNQMRAWTFPPSELPVQLRFTLLFVPSGIDEASIVSWEKQLGNRPVMENFDEASPPEVAAAAEGAMGTASQEQREEPSAKSHAKAPTPEKKPVVTPESQPKQKKETAPSEITGWYRVLYPTALRTAPQRSAKVIAQLRGGTRVRVVNVVNGQWLEVRSVSDRPPGFLWWEDAVPERPEKVGRK